MLSQTPAFAYGPTSRGRAESQHAHEVALGVQDEAAVHQEPRERLRPQRRRLPRHPVRPGHRLTVGLPQAWHDSLPRTALQATERCGVSDSPTVDKHLMCSSSAQGLGGIRS